MKPSALFVTIAPLVPMPYILYVAAPRTWRADQIAGLGLLLLGILFVTVARLQLRDSFSITPQARALVTHGLYAHIRNPIYVFSTVFVAGVILYFDHPWLLLLLVPLTAVQVVRAGRESKVLEERFGDAYRAYKAGTWF